MSGCPISPDKHPTNRLTKSDRSAPQTFLLTNETPDWYSGWDGNHNMQRGIARRIENLEASLPIPLTAERFLSRADEHARRAGISVQAAAGILARDLTDGEVDSLTAELEQFVFGADFAARDAARRRVLIVADEGSLSVLAPSGCPIWTSKGRN